MKTTNELEALRATYRALRAKGHEATKARDAIASCFSPEWRRLHEIARNAYLASEVVEKRIARILEADPAWAPTYLRAIDGRRRPA